MDNEAEPYVRVATREELEELVYMNQRAFYRSPPQTFFSGVTTPLKTDKSDFKRQNKQPTENEKERIAASAIWRPPITAEHKPPSMVAALRLGLIPVLAAWGYGALKRITELIHASESSLDKGFEARQLQGTPDDAYFQGKGFMSKLIREAFGHTPDAIFTLESTTPYSRGRYEHFGFQASFTSMVMCIFAYLIFSFQVVEEVIVGKGKADSGGVVASREAATGFTIYPMIKS
ncbi:hypothetical protein BDZ89DRAFT_1137249 [Hymenopellis radicata]|nr:hypothetical protein BDZ89DRAFT_1137249 [Hymenopellis radicata]